jgi:hypothetical protein
MLPAAIVIDSIASLFTEAYEGPRDGSAYWFSDGENGDGVLGTLSSISATEASASPDGSGRAGSTIAAHAEHLRWSLAFSNALARGEQPEADWEQSWKVLTVDTGEWDRLRDALGREYRALLQEIEGRSGLPEFLVTPGIAIVAHAAYHLGAIRQLVRLLKRV